MGDRRQILIRPFLYFYTHWDGEDLGIALQCALKASEDFWDDEPIAFKITLTELLRPYFDTTGDCGLSFSSIDSDFQYKDYEVDFNMKRVGFVGEKDKISFEDFCDMSEAEILALDS